VKKILNSPKNFVDETMEGFLLAYSEKMEMGMAYTASRASA
jgi:hypothetical protein